MANAFDINILNELEIYFRERKKIEIELAELTEIERTYLIELEATNTDITKLVDKIYRYKSIAEIAKKLNENYPVDEFDDYFSTSIEQIERIANLENQIIVDY